MGKHKQALALHTYGIEGIRDMKPNLPVDDIDILVVIEIGKYFQKLIVIRRR
jgi:hypothetical protein